jgi:hypothetical protein
MCCHQRAILRPLRHNPALPGHVSGPRRDVEKESLLPIPSPARSHEQLRADLRQAQEELRVAEADLAAEQAAVNAFRMHARLMLDDLADAILALRARKQSLLTELALQETDDDDPLGPAANTAPPPLDADDDLPLPTPTPRDRAAEKRLYRELARRFHPDLAETAGELAYRTSVMTAVNAAYTAGDTQALYDLAGELEPEELRELAQIETREARQLRERLMQCRRRRRKIVRQLDDLRRESTARLWRLAREMDEPNENWWAAVRRELAAARARLEAEVAGLEERAAGL